MIIAILTLTEYAFSLTLRRLQLFLCLVAAAAHGAEHLGILQVQTKAFLALHCWVGVPSRLVQLPI